MNQADRRRRPQMSLEEFEELSRGAPEGVKPEFIDGRLEVHPLPDRAHLTAIARAGDACLGGGGAGADGVLR